MKRDTKTTLITDSRGVVTRVPQAKAAASRPAKTIWVGTVPDIFGYGMAVVGKSEAEVMKALRANYRKWKKDIAGFASRNNAPQLVAEKTTFDGSFENFGGNVKEVEIGKVYYDNFSE